MFVCLLVCWSAFYRPHDICPLCGAASEYSERAGAVAGGPPRARGQAHPRPLARARARMPYNFSRKKSRADAVRARACCRIRYCRDYQKKGKRKPTCHFPSSVYSFPSLNLGVFTFRIVLNRTSSLVGADLGMLSYT